MKITLLRGILKINYHSTEGLPHYRRPVDGVYIKNPLPKFGVSAAGGDPKFGQWVLDVCPVYPVFDSAVSESRTRKTEVTSSNEITIGCGAAESGCGCGRTAGRRSVHVYLFINRSLPIAAASAAAPSSICISLPRRLCSV